MQRIPGIDPNEADKRIAAVLNAQEKTWGAPLVNHLIYARRPAIFHGARAMWGALDASGLIDDHLVALLNRRVASINDCPF